MLQSPSLQGFEHDEDPTIRVCTAPRQVFDQVAVGGAAKCGGGYTPTATGCEGYSTTATGREALEIVINQGKQNKMWHSFNKKETWKDKGNM